MSEIQVAPKPKRRRGAQPGNLNGSKNPWLTFWRRRAVKESDSWIIPLIQEYADGLISDKGGVDGATAAERRTIEIAQTARGAAMLILKECSERGMVVNTENGWDLAPGAKELSRFLGVELNALRTIGMERRAPKELTLQDLLAEAEADETASRSNAFSPQRANGVADDLDPSPSADRADLSEQHGGTDER